MKTFLSTLAITLAFSFTAAPADAAQTLLQKCRSNVAKVEMDYAKCLKKGVFVEEKGKTADWDRCAQKRSVGFLKTQAIYVARQGVDSEACGLDETSLSVSKALMLVASGENPANHGISAEVLVGTPFDGTIDNAAVAEATCGEAGGTWESGTCTASYNCTIGAMCSAFATQYPEDLEFYTNSYVGHTAATYGCPQQPWDEFGGCVVALNELSHSAIESRKLVVVNLRAACE